MVEAVRTTEPEWPSSLGLVRRQIGYQLLIFRRTPVAAFFALIMPLIMLLLFGGIIGDVEIPGDREVEAAQFYAPGLAVFSAVSSTYTNLGIGIAITRDEGVLKRVRGTPLPSWVYLSGLAGSAVVIALTGVVVMMVTGVVFYGIDVDAAKLPAALVTFLIGTASFSALGLALSALASSGQSAPALANATLLPLAFVSNVFIPTGEDPPRWITLVGDIFPLKAFVDAFFQAFNPFRDDAAFEPWLLARIALWGLGGAIVAWRFFKWEPQQGE